jgi:hypothetical protein
MKKDKMLILTTVASIKEQAAWMVTNTSINTRGLEKFEHSCLANNDEFIYYIEIQNGRVRIIGNPVENINSCFGFDQNVKDILILEYPKNQRDLDGVVCFQDGEWQDV